MVLTYDLANSILSAWKAASEACQRDKQSHEQGLLWGINQKRHFSEKYKTTLYIKATGIGLESALTSGDVPGARITRTTVHDSQPVHLAEKRNPVRTAEVLTGCSAATKGLGHVLPTQTELYPRQLTLSKYI